MPSQNNEILSIAADDVVWREVGDELIVLELSTSTYLMLNGTGKVIWEALVDTSTSESLVGKLVAEYGITEEQAQVDVDAFVGSLAERGILRVGS